MSHSVDIVIKDGDRIIGESKAKPVRLTPGGYVGVVHGGVVYPLRAGNCVDLKDPVLSRADCPTFLEARQEIIYYSPEADDDLVWFTDFRKNGNYLVFDGNDDLADGLFEHLSELMIAQRLGASFRPAKDGYQYDWFIRIRPGVSEAQLINAVQSFDLAPATGQPSTTEADPEVLREGIRALTEFLDVILIERSDLRDQLDQSTVELEAVREDIREARTTISSMKAQLQEATESLARTQTALAATKLARDAYKDAADSARNSVRGLRARQAIPKQASSSAAEASDRQDNDQLLALADNEIAELKNRERDLILQNERLAAELCSRDETITALETRVDSQVKQASGYVTLLTRRTRRDQAARLLGMMADCFLARVRLEEEDLYCLANEVKSPRRLLELLRAIDRRDPVDAKAWRGPPSGVKEISKINVGNLGAGDMGRLYFRGEADGSVRVALHIKEDASSQERFVARRF